MIKAVSRASSKLVVLLVCRMLNRMHLIEHVVNLRGIEVLENLGEQLCGLDGEVGAGNVVVKVERIGVSLPWVGPFEAKTGGRSVAVRMDVRFD